MLKCELIQLGKEAGDGERARRRGLILLPKKIMQLSMFVIFLNVVNPHHQKTIRYKFCWLINVFIHRFAE